LVTAYPIIKTGHFVQFKTSHGLTFESSVAFMQRLTLRGTAAHRADQRSRIAEVEQRIGYREIEARKESAEGAVWDAEYDVMEAKPATPAGAVALLRFVAGLMEGFFPDDDEHEHYVGAIRNAADFFEGGTTA
jgi:hypothetical protein